MSAKVCGRYFRARARWAMAVPILPTSRREVA
jgi:hypothetical protein